MYHHYIITYRCYNNGKTFSSRGLMLLENKTLMLLDVKIFRFENNTLNRSMLNTKQTANNSK